MKSALFFQIQQIPDNSPIFDELKIQQLTIFYFIQNTSR